MRKRLLYGLVGFACGTVIELALQVLAGVRVFGGIAIVVSVIALWWAERRGKVPTGEEIHRPITLFIAEKK